MDYLRYLDRPQLRKPTWVGAFIGWADAQEGASRAIRFLIEALEARKFAELDPEEFYDFTATRPVALLGPDGQRVIRWPSNEFFHWTSPDGARELIIFLGTEPGLKWRSYINALLSVTEPYNMDVIMNVGSLMDAIPHTREPILSGSANRDDVKKRLGGLRIMGSTYQGPVGITSVLMDACTKRGLGYMSLWAHAPHYVQRAPNYKVTKALAARLGALLGIPLPLSDLEGRAQAFEAEVTRAISESVEVSAYVKRLERQYDAAIAQGAQAQGQGEPLPPPDVVVKELEEFLRKDRPDSQGFSTN